MIHFLANSEIDKAAYDQCIASSDNETIYAYSWYLDVVAPGWSAMVVEDYQTVMPVPHRSKLGIHYVYTPIFVQQLGALGTLEAKDIYKMLIEKIPEQFKLVDLKFNEQNKIKATFPDAKLRKNYLLDLEADYPKTCKKYNRNCRRKLKKAEEAGLELELAINPHEFAQFVRANLEDQIKELKRKEIAILEKLVTEGIKRERCELLGVLDSKGTLCAAASFFKTKNRITFSVCASSKTGKHKQAMAFLVDQQIRRTAGHYQYFDFSGSELDGVAYFNSTFGARVVNYAHLSINNLNWLERFLSGKR